MSDQQCPTTATPNLRPDYTDSPTDQTILPSFRDIRAKTLRALYGLSDGNHTLQLYIDKSPKGSVDDAIRNLVDLINSHPSYATLSSCSGRIAIFDPSASATADGVGNDIDEREGSGDNVGSNIPSGKGSGRWALSSHATITAEQLIDILDDNSTDSTSDNNTPLIFKHEPLLLHVAASCLPRAEKLLSLALSLGFRESGIVSTPKRCTVAIRGVGLSLTVPLARSGPLRPSNEYLGALVKEANDRFILNDAKLVALYEKVKADLFVVTETGDTDEGYADASNTGTMRGAQNDSYEAIFRPLPPLNLWGHAAVVVPSSASDGCNSDINVYAFGGHGTGPEANGRCERSDAFYCLSRSDGNWADSWKRLNAVKTDAGPSKLDRGFQCVHGIHTQRATFSAREGLAACLLPSVASDPDGSPLVAIFGGRAGPASPSDELFLYCPLEHPGCLWSPTDVRGEAPSARWGHTLTPLSGRNGRVAVLCGGRTTRGLVSTAHILALCPSEKDDGAVSHILWEKIENDISLFQHVAVRLSFDEESNEDKVLLFGGSTDACNLLDVFSTEADESNENSSQPLGFVFSIDADGKTSVKNMTVPRDVASSGASACLISSTKRPVLIVSGGVPHTVCNQPALRQIRFEKDGDNRRLVCCPVHCRLASGTSVDRIRVGSMVRHCCLSLPFKSGENPSLLLVGGGISSFAFAPTFGPTWIVSVERGASLVSNNVCSKEPIFGTNAVVKDNASLPATQGTSMATTVVYVEKSKAKELKNALEDLSFLDKTFRMLNADDNALLDDPSRYIAVPITASCDAYLSQLVPDDTSSSSSPWVSLVAGRGHQVAPFSTKMLGNRRARR